MATERRVAGTVAVAGSVTLFDHIIRVPGFTPEFGTTFIRPAGKAPGQVRYGGCGLNQAVALARLGIRAEALGVVGRDFAPSGYAAYLDQQGVGRELLAVVDAPSGHSYLLHADDGGTLLVVEEGAATAGIAPAASPPIPPGTKLACINMPFDEYSCAIANTAHAAGAQVLLAGQLGTAAPGCRAALAAVATWICCNAAEAKSTGVDAPAADGRPEFPALRGTWITEGAAGIRFASASGGGFQVPSVPGTLADATGAGDGVVAGIAAGMMLGLSLEEATRLGAVVASFVIEAVGAQTSAPALPDVRARYRRAFGRPPPALAADQDPA